MALFFSSKLADATKTSEYLDITLETLDTHYLFFLPFPLSTFPQMKQMKFFLNPEKIRIIPESG